jgi:hypothetical protein
MYLAEILFVPAPPFPKREPPKNKFRIDGMIFEPEK